MHLDVTADSYGYYPRTMVRLSDIANYSLDKIPVAVAALGLRVVWGPAELTKDDEPYSRMFVCMRAQPNEYTVVIRGTDPLSWEAWWDEDFAIGKTEPFNQLAPHAPANALVSQGTFNGINDLLSLEDPRTGVGVVPFLQGAKPQSLYVTGHSLGGTLTPPMFALLNDHLYGGGHVTNMALWSFAGLTPGDAGFNSYFNGLGNPAFPFRLHNTLDVAPFCWWSLDGVRTIYSGSGLDWGEPESGAITALFAEGALHRYAQPQGDQALPGVFSTSGIDPYVWALQAAYQHQTSTYIKLVDAMYPSPQELQVQAKGKVGASV